MRKLLISLIVSAALAAPAMASANGGVDQYTEGPPSAGGPGFSGPGGSNPGSGTSSGSSDPGSSASSSATGETGSGTGTGTSVTGESASGGSIGGGGASGTGTSAVGTDPAGGSLALTGLNTTALLLIGVAFLLSGLVIRTRTRKRTVRQNRSAVRTWWKRSVAVAKRTPRLVPIAVTVLLATLLMASVASARGLTTGFIDGLVFQSPSAQTRGAWLQRAKQDGAGMIRISVRWREVVGATPPLTPTNPADPAYDMADIDAAVKSARARGLDVFLTPYAAPDWAEGANQPVSVPQGSWKPNPTAFGQFGQMLATRYSGLYKSLPRVKYFEAWNEPNLTNFLAPQWENMKPFSPSWYRQMLNKFYTGVKRAQPGAKVIGGATAPFGDDAGSAQSLRMRPLVFLRKLFCLRDNLKPAACSGVPHLDILSHHPVNILNAPTRPAPNPNDVEVADFHKLGELMDAANAADHVVPGGQHPLWASEIWWFSKPPNRIGIPIQKHARWLEEGLYLLWKQGASVVVNYEIRDHSYNPFLAPQAQVTSGVFFMDGRRKPAYTAFRFPFVTHRISSQRVGIWGRAPVGGELAVQQRTKTGWQTVDTFTVKAGQVFVPSIQLAGSANLRATVGGIISLSWHQD